MLSAISLLDAWVLCREIGLQLGVSAPVPVDVAFWFSGGMLVACLVWRVARLRDKSYAFDLLAFAFSAAALLIRSLSLANAAVPLPRPCSF
ncbi:MAG: hypothetical protein IJ678_09145 [Kiritimatiellae bacterium]|nr:hypothetical protein [Kiritimatiellia bacterium]